MDNSSTMDNSTMVFGNYIIHMNKIIGKGQFGSVYEVTNNEIQQPLCCKIIRIFPKIQQSVERESKIMLSLCEIQNENLVKLYDIKTTNDQCIIIMEKCIGQDLDQVINHQIKNNIFRPLTYIFNILKQICNGYQELHRRKIIHRDLKPANLLVGNDGKLKICDFGMGRIVEDVNTKLCLTKVGTPAYAAPQLFFEKTFSTKADVYSFGIIIYQLLFNQFPFKANNQGQLIECLKILRENYFACPEIQQEGTHEQKQFFKKFIEKTITFQEENRYSWDEVFKLVNQNENSFSSQMENSKGKKKIKIISKSEIQEISQLQDSMFINQVTHMPQVFKIKISNSQIQLKTKTDRTYQIVTILLAKYQLVNNLMMTYCCDLEKFLPSNPKFTKFEFNLILACIIGYLSAIISTATGFVNNKIDLLSNSIKQNNKHTELEQGLEEFFNDRSERILEIRDEVQKRNDDIKKIIPYHSGSAIKSLCQLPQLDATLQSFQNVLMKEYFYDYHVYVQFYQKFYLQYLMPLLPVTEDKQAQPDYFKLVAHCEKFYYIEEEFPFEGIYNQYPNQIKVGDNLDIQKNYIISKRSQRQQ